MSFSVQCEASSLEYNGASINALFAQRRNLLRSSFWSILVDILRFNREAPKLLAKAGSRRGDQDLTLVLWRLLALRLSRRRGLCGATGLPQQLGVEV